MSFTAVRKLAVVSFFVIGGLLITGSLYAGTSPYVEQDWSTVNNIWGTTFDDKDGVYNQGHYFAEWMGSGGNPNRDYGSMPQEDTTYIWEINAPFDMAQTSWSPTVADVPTTMPLYQALNNNCDPATLAGAIYGMNDTDHVYLALILEAEGINMDDRLNVYFDPDNITPVAEFVEGSSYMVGLKLGNVTFQPGTGNTVVNEGVDETFESGEMSFCNGHWLDWDNSGSRDTWETISHWPQVDVLGAQTYPMERDTGDPDDLTVVPRSTADWGDSTGTYPEAGAYWDTAQFANNMNWGGFEKDDFIMVQFKIPITHLGCSLALGSPVGFAIEYLNDYNGNGEINSMGCGFEETWFPGNIKDSGPPANTGWDKYDATYMGVMYTNSLNIGNRLWGAWFDITADRTSYLVLKNVSDEVAGTKVKFYESLHGDASERWAPLPGAGELILGTQCIEIPPHSVTTVQLETAESGILRNHTGCIEVTNTDLAGYVMAYVGLDSGSVQKYAWSVDLELTPFTPAEWTSVNSMNASSLMLTNKWYIVGEVGWDYNTSIVIVNPNPIYSTTASLTLYPARFYNDSAVMNICADTGFHPDFDGDYNGTSLCGDVTGDTGDVITIPPHQAVELRMWELLNQWVAGWTTGSSPYDFSQEITDPTNAYWHFRKGTVEVNVMDGDDDTVGDETALDETLFGITARESSSHGWGENMQRYYE